MEENVLRKCILMHLTVKHAKVGLTEVCCNTSSQETWTTRPKWVHYAEPQTALDTPEEDKEHSVNHCAYLYDDLDAVSLSPLLSDFGPSLFHTVPF